MTAEPTPLAHRRTNDAGFTLTEVLLVLAILGVIAAMVVPNLLGQQQVANIRATKMNIKGFEDAVSQYAIANDGVITLTADGAAAATASGTPCIPPFGKISPATEFILAKTE